MMLAAVNVDEFLWLQVLHTHKDHAHERSTDNDMAVQSISIPRSSVKRHMHALTMVPARRCASRRGCTRMGRGD